MNEISEVAKLELRRARIELANAKPYWTPEDLCAVFDISVARLGNLEREGNGPDWMRIGGTKHIVASTARQWFEKLGRQP